MASSQVSNPLPTLFFNILDPKFIKSHLQDIVKDQESPQPESDSEEVNDEDQGGGNCCLSCSIQDFEDTEAQRSHFKSDFHRYNLKKKLASSSFTPVSEEAFEELSEVSSISASESEEEERETTLNDPRVYFRNGAGLRFSVFKAIFKQDEDQYLPLKDPPIVAVLMVGGGHFAGAIFESDGRSSLHKTFHSYTVRKKQGGSQSSADNKGRHHKSAGSSLRRYNELSFAQKVKDILSTWKSQLEAASFIFYRSSSSNLHILFGKDSPISHLKRDSKVRTIPFPTRRATFKEITRVREHLLTCKIHCSDESDKRSRKKKTPKRIRRSKSREVKERPLPSIVSEILQGSSSEEEVVDIDYDLRRMKTVDLSEFEVKVNDNEDKNELITATMSGNVRTVEECLAANPELLNAPIVGSGSTLLHLATRRGHKGVVKLLLGVGADPSLKDRSKKVPYLLCPDKETRNVYRRFCGDFPDKFDYKKALIPPPLDEETAKEQAAKKAEKKKAQRAQKKERDKEVKAQELTRLAEQNEKDRFLALSDREKRAIAAEKRMLSSQEGHYSSSARCFQCGSDLTGKVPFSYEDYRFCLIECVKLHKKKIKK